MDDRQNYRLVLAYDGRDYFGWQRLGDDPTIQGALEHALGELLGVDIELRGAGRTDRGAHAEGQVASVLLPKGLEDDAVLAQLNAVLPESIRVLSLSPAAADFHARTSAVGKRYRYVIHNAPDCPASRVGRVWHIPGRLDIDAMREALPVLIGEHDFASFATKPKHKRQSTVRTVTELSLQREAPTVELSIRADSFLYKMVRNIVRAVVKVGEGRYDVDDLRRILAARSRAAAPGTAPASGLYLERVFYPPRFDNPPPGA